MGVEFHPAAAGEVEDAQDWYERRSVFAASAFLRELSIAVDRIRRAPGRYGQAEGGTQQIRLDRFPFTPYYRVGADIVTIVAVAHQKRRPGYWRAR